jgi:uncharacterized RmlC-like cupin family protein
MSHELETGAYRACEEPAYLRAAVSELFALIPHIDKLISSASETHAHPERVAGLCDTRTFVTQQLQRAKHRLDQVGANAPARRPAVIDPSAVPSIQARHGQLLNVTISAPAVPTEGISSAEVWMPPGHAAYAHVHHDTDLIVVVRDGEALTLWWDEDGNLHELSQRTGQHLHIPRGVPHAAVNVTARPVLATEFRSNSVFNADTYPLATLDQAVRRRVQATAPAA